MTFSKDRRRLLGGIAGLGSVALASPYLIRPAYAQQGGVVDIISYQGFIPEAFKAQFEAETGIELRIRLTDDSAKVYSMLVAEGDSSPTDIILNPGQMISRYFLDDLISPIDSSNISGWGGLLDAYTDSDWIRHEGQLGGMPIAAMTVILPYSTERIDNVDSWDAIFSEENAGRISWRLKDFFHLVLNYMGYDGNLVAYMGNDAEAERVVNEARDFLISRKHLVRKFYESGTEMQQMFINDEISVSHSWSGPVVQLARDGLPIGMGFPKEGTFGAVFNWSMTKNAPNRENAYRFLDAYSSNPDMWRMLNAETGHATAFKNAEVQPGAFSMTDEQARSVNMYREDNATVKYALFERAEAEVQAA